MLDLYVNNKDNPVSIKEISKRQEVSEKYLEQIAGYLLRRGMIGSIRGAGGGYFLKRQSGNYTVGEILRVMEGDLAPAPCVEKDGIPCKRKDICTNIVLWKKINDAVNSVVDSITLEDMYKWQNKTV